MEDTPYGWTLWYMDHNIYLGDPNKRYCSARGIWTFEWRNSEKLDAKEWDSKD